MIEDANKCEIVVYTAIFGGYDTLKDPVCKPDGVDFICYTDSNNLKSDVWKIVKVNVDNLSPSIYNRRLKLLYPYTELKGYDYSLYVDGSIQIKSDVFTFLAKYIDKKPVLMNFKHPSNDDIFKEMISCIKEGRGNAEKLIEQYNIYINDGMPRYYGLSDNKIILRDNHSQLGEILMNEWLDHVVKYSGRDQVCLSYVLWKHNIHYNYFEENIEDNLFFETWPHVNDSKMQWRWRKFKWFCDRHNICQGLISFLNNKIKQHFIK